jgi:dihydrofolate reductase/thymidylate synthase
VYLRSLKSICQKGNTRDDRTGTGTISIFGSQIRFNIEKNIPLLTTKFVPFQVTIKELLFFLKGQTDAKILQQQNVHIWDGNTTDEFIAARGLPYPEGTMGPMYGFLWNYYSAEYVDGQTDYTGKGFSQLEMLRDGLKNDPFSRRHLLTSYCPSYADAGVLYPCHSLIVQWYVTEKSGKKYLSAHFTNRSMDTFLGEPLNILSHTLFIYIMAKMCDMIPYELIMSIGDGHVYLNHLEQVKLQLSRHVLPLPVLKISDIVKEKNFNEIQVADFELIGYLSHPKITAPMAV